MDTVLSNKTDSQYEDDQERLFRNSVETMSADNVVMNV